ncbi:MAG: hypothetical protein ABIP71_12930 [Verrucomicrobiota bacterium]
MRKNIFFAFGIFLTMSGLASERQELRVGVAGHAFDHLGSIAEQAEAAAASGSTIIYGTGFGGIGYLGIPSQAELAAQHKSNLKYLRHAKRNGIQLALGYVCATSIVKLETFDRNWTPDFRAKFSTAPSEWLQQDCNGKALPSWYGGDYRPGCMNHPDWLTYEKFIVRQQIESGHDGIFFDNPTVHPQGCYCEHCMKKFAKFLTDEGKKIHLPKTNLLTFLRQLAVNQPKDFMRFRCTTARDFLGEIRRYARTINRNALITCNNSLNSPGVFFSQSRDYAYNIYEMSKTEDLVVVEDMTSQPRILPNGNAVEYGHVYELLQAISRNKPLVAVAIAEGDYHTPPNLVRLAMAEAAAHRASYLSWPTWPEAQRARMGSDIRPQADFLRKNQTLLNDVRPRADVLLFLPFRKWLNTPDCWALNAAAALTRSNLQFQVVCEDDFVERLGARLWSKTQPQQGARAAAGAAHTAALHSETVPILLLESLSDLNQREKESVENFQKKKGRIISDEKGNWFSEVRTALAHPSIVVDGPPTVRATVCDQKNKTVVHLLNLNIQRLSSFEDKVTPASNVRIKVRVPFTKVHSVEMLNADAGASQQLQFTSQRGKDESWIETTIPELKISAIVVLK